MLASKFSIFLYQAIQFLPNTIPATPKSSGELGFMNFPTFFVLSFWLIWAVYIFPTEIIGRKYYQICIGFFAAVVMTIFYCS